MTTKPNQADRVLAALRAAGSRGITRDDFEAPRGRPVIDGGPLIKRVARCIGDLKDAGHTIVNGPKRAGCATYVLVGSPPKGRPHLCRWLDVPGGSLWVRRWFCNGCLLSDRQLIGPVCECGRAARVGDEGPWLDAIPEWLNPPSIHRRSAAA